MKPAASASLARVQDEIIAEMAGLEDGPERYAYVVAQGKVLSAPDDGLRTETYSIPGCQVSVWLRAELDRGRLRLRADSDALVTRGILALLLRVLDGRTPAEVLAADLYFLDRTGLTTQLSPARANGLAAVVDRIRAYAADCGDAP